MNRPQRTALYDRHVSLGAQIVEFGGWDMPMQYPAGILQEHLTTRRQAGLFDVAHMGRFIIRGAQALPFLQFTLTNDAARLAVGQSHYTIIPTATGGALDDAYLYRFREDEFLLVVNASNRAADWAFFAQHQYRFDDVEVIDRTHDLAMLSLQGPQAGEILAALLSAGALPEIRRNSLSIGQIEQFPVWIARTGYTGEPICFELIVPVEHAGRVWDGCCARGAAPVGLGARDTLRLEAGLPLYGHELGTDLEDREIPILAAPAAHIAVNLNPDRRECLGRAALAAQLAAWQRIRQHDYADIAALPRRVVLLALTGKGIARSGSAVFQGDRKVGYVTSGTMVPYWRAGADGHLTDETDKRAIALALLDSARQPGDELDVDIRGKRAAAVIVKKHLDASQPPYARAVV